MTKELNEPTKPKSFHLSGDQANQLEQANSALFGFVKCVFVLLLLAFVFKTPVSSDGEITISLPSVSMPSFAGHATENGNAQFAKYKNSDPVCEGEFWCFLGWKL
jgi:hypothetical protein